MKMAGRRRGFKSWFVEPYRQVKLGLLFLILNLVFASLILGIFGYFVWDVYQTVANYFKLAGDQQVFTMAKFTLPLVVGTGLIALFVLTTLLISVRYTHQIYGPLVSIHRFLDDLLQDRRPDFLQLRESDQLKDLADRLNSLAERFASGQRQSPMVPVHRFLDDLLAGKSPTALQLRDSDQLVELSEKLNKLAQKLGK